MIYILHGTQESRVQQKLDALKKKHKIQDNIVTIDAANTSQDVLWNEMDSVSIFEDTKMIVVENATFLSSKDKTHYSLEELLKRKENDSLIVVYCCPSEKLDKRKTLVKKMIASAKVYACIALDDKSLPSYVEERMNRLQLTMDREAYQYFIARAGQDAMRIDSELNKLKTYADRITLEDVKALMSVEPLNDVFKMVDALFERNALRLLAYYRNFRQLNMEPVAINGLLASQLRFLFQVRVLMDARYTSDEIASRLKAHPYRVKVNVKRASNFTGEELLEQLSLIASLDQNMKMGLVDMDQGFEQFVLEMLERK